VKSGGRIVRGGSTSRRLSIDRPYKVRLRGYEVEGGGEGVLDGLPCFEDLCDDGFFGVVGVGEHYPVA
jgi:hypothetical protein